MSYDVSGEESQFTGLYEREYPHIARYLLRRGVGERAADLAAETFVVAWRQREQWLALPAERHRPWLYGVARKVLANSIRSEQRAAALTDRIAADRSIAAAVDHNGLTVERLAVAEAFERLSEADQELIRLVAWEELTPAQAAEVLGCRVATLTMRLHRARTRLKKQITISAAKGL
ncbi:RNA polymerase sigma factor [Streptacidiphilus sp. PAMC 29251]